MTIKKWLHLADNTGDPWVLPIWNAANDAIKNGKVGPITKEMSESAIHVSTRFSLLPKILNKLNQSTHDLLRAVKAYEDENVFTDGKEGYAMRVDSNLTSQVILAISSFLFEVNACAELMARFFQKLNAHVGSAIPDDQMTTKLRQALTKQGVAEAWFKLLGRNRNFTAHAGTPYLAIDVSAHPQIIVMKENLHRFDDATKYFEYSELQVIYNGFAAAKDGLQKHLIGLYR